MTHIANFTIQFLLIAEAVVILVFALNRDKLLPKIDKLLIHEVILKNGSIR